MTLYEDLKWRGLIKDEAGENLEKIMNKEKIGSKIKELRLKNKLSQEKLALLSNLDRTYIASVENGKRNISIVNLEKIIIALDTTLENFFKGL